MKTRAGAVLLEILLSLAIFVSAALAVGGAVRRTTAGMLRTQEHARGADLAWSAIAQVEAGALTPEAIHGPSGDGWLLSVETTQTEHGGLVLLSVTAQHEGVKVYTGRQLVRLRSRGESGPAWRARVEESPSPFGEGEAP